MSALSRITRLKRSILMVRQLGHFEKISPWYIDNKPGPYPKTEEEKVAAAKKYGLLREEYEPYPDDGSGFGDYPKVQDINVESKDFYLMWDDDYHNRNFGDVISPYYPAFQFGGSDTGRERFTFMQLLMYTLAAPLTAIFVLYISNDIRTPIKSMDKDYPTPGVTHYRFDFLEDDEEPKKHH